MDFKTVDVHSRILQYKMKLAGSVSPIKVSHYNFVSLFSHITHSHLRNDIILFVFITHLKRNNENFI